MSTPYERLRDDLQAEVDEPGPVTKAELRDVLARHTPNESDPGDFADEDFDRTDFA